MKKAIFLVSACMLLICANSFAQQATADSVYPKANTDSLSLVKKISDYQLKLGELQNEVEQKTKNKQDASAKAQQSADDNAVAANKLSDNPDNKKLARRANNSAGDAKSDAKTSRKETKRLDKLYSQISDLKKKIAGEQTKLNKYVVAGIRAQQ